LIHVPPLVVAMELDPTGDKASLVEQIKKLQRSSPEAKQAWWDFCDTQLGGVKDPSRHEAPVLSEFVQGYQEGNFGGSLARAPSQQPRRAPPSGRGYYGTYAPAWGSDGWGCGWGGGGYGGGGYGGAGFGGPSQWGAAGHGNVLADFIKTGQRNSAHWKKAWQTYCAAYGTSYNDPARCDESFIVGFIDYAGQLITSELGGQDDGPSEAPTSVLSRKRPIGVVGASAGFPPAKRGCGGGWEAWDGAGGGRGAYSVGGIPSGAEKAALVDKIKALQRSSPEAKSAWWSYCDEHLGGIKDPMRHEEESLQTFLQQYSQGDES